LEEILIRYIPEHAVAPVFELIKNYRVHLKIVNERVTRHGDYRRNPDGRHHITVNANLNKYRFLITLIHEIAHLVAFQKFGNRIKPHGIEWKQTFRLLMLPFINTYIFPEKVLPVVAAHFQNPTASSDTDARLSMVLKSFDEPTEQIFMNDLPLGSYFRIYNGKIFKKGALRVKRFECTEVKTGKIYLFKPNAEVELLKVD